MVTKSKTLYVRSPLNTLETNLIGGVSPKYTGLRLFTVNRTRTGYPNPKWRQQVRDVLNATTQMSATEETIEFVEGAALAHKQDGQHDPLLHPHVDLDEFYTGCFPAEFVSTSPAGAPFADETTARNLALKRLYQAIRSQTTHFSGGTFLGELKESLKTIRSVTGKIANLIPQHLAAQQKLTKRYVGSYVIGPNGSAVRVKDFNPRKGKRLSESSWTNFRKELADNWLEFAFGVRPLFGDVHDGAEALARFQYDSVHDHVRAYGNSTSNYLSTRNNNQFSGILGTGSYTDDRWQEVQIIYRAGLKFSVSSPAFGTADRLRGLLGFKLEDFVPTMWNLLPYSFLVDYFVNVGDILEAITTDTSSVRWVNETVVKISHQRYDSLAHTLIDQDPPVQIRGNYGSVIKKNKTVDRHVSTLQIPIPEFEVPGLSRDGKFNQQWLNIVALLSGGKGARRGF